MPKTSNFDAFMNYVNREVDSAKDVLENTKINPLTFSHFLEWNGDRIAKDAAVVEIGEGLLELLTSDNHGSRDLAVEYVKEDLLMQIVGCAKYPKMSTSPMANFMYVVRQSVRAEFHERLISIMQR